MTDLRAFTYGIMVGIAILIGSFALVSYMAGLKWQPVKVSSLASDERSRD